MFDLNGKVAIVTGANQGLGFAMCQGLAKAGADIFVAGSYLFDGNDADLPGRIDELRSLAAKEK